MISIIVAMSMPELSLIFFMGLFIVLVVLYNQTVFNREVDCCLLKYFQTIIMN